MLPPSLVSLGLDVLRCEIAALESACRNMGDSFNEAVQLIMERPQAHVVASGIGKAGIIAQKAVATLASTGTAAIFLHPADALHGDLGAATPGDVGLLFSNSGESGEIKRLIPFLRRRGLKLIAVTGTMRSTLGVQSDVVLAYGQVREACPFGFAPTASTTAMLALADALAIALMQRRGVTVDHYGQLHPAGELGRRAVSVREVMRGMSATALLSPTTTLKATLVAMTEARAGAALVVADTGELLGIFTDGDLRRCLLSDGLTLDRPISELMNSQPSVIHQDQSIMDALELIHEHRIGELPVLDETDKVIGMVDLKSLEV